MLTYQILCQQLLLNKYFSLGFLRFLLFGYKSVKDYSFFLLPIVIYFLWIPLIFLEEINSLGHLFTLLGIKSYTKIKWLTIVFLLQLERLTQNSGKIMYFISLVFPNILLVRIAIFLILFTFYIRSDQLSFFLPIEKVHFIFPLVVDHCFPIYYQKNRSFLILDQNWYSIKSYLFSFKKRMNFEIFNMLLIYLKLKYKEMENYQLLTVIGNE